MTLRYALLIVLFALFSGCEALNDAIVRQMHKDWGVSRRTSDQIVEGLKRRKAEEPPAIPKKEAPPFMDQG